MHFYDIDMQICTKYANVWTVLVKNAKNMQAICQKYAEICW